MTENQPAAEPPETNPKIPAPGTSEDFPAYRVGNEPSGPVGVEVPARVRTPRERLLLWRGFVGSEGYSAARSA